MNAGDKVSVKLPRNGGVQNGIVIRVLPDGRFVWKNDCNYERTSRPEQLTEEPEQAGKLDPYLASWVKEPGE